ncbi:hypothetical protein PV518_48995, partial [Streptomyces sp. ND04-05B]|uniref:hypothetical protein n=1 Tax=Streptomyces sp. ND04-05B TaxID=3028693 RepID=UPI0029AC882B
LPAKPHPRAWPEPAESDACIRRPSPGHQCVRSRALGHGGAAESPSSAAPRPSPPYRRTPVRRALSHPQESL